jgi:hypothetical protein
MSLPENVTVAKYLSCAIEVSKLQESAGMGEYYHNLPHIGVAAMLRDWGASNNQLRHLSKEFTTLNPTRTIYPHMIGGDAFMEAVIVLEADNPDQEREESSLEVVYFPFHAALKRGMFHRGLTEADFGDMENFSQYLTLSQSLGIYTGNEQAGYLESDLYTLISRLSGEADQRQRTLSESQETQGIRLYNIKKDPLVWINVSDLSGTVIDRHADKIAIFREMALLHRFDLSWHELYYRFLQGENIRPSVQDFKAAMEELQKPKALLNGSLSPSPKPEILEGFFSPARGKPVPPKPREEIIIEHVSTPTATLDKIDDLARSGLLVRAFGELQVFEQQHFGGVLSKKERRARIRRIKYAEDQTQFSDLEIRHINIYSKIDAERSRLWRQRQKITVIRSLKSTKG